jgi:hypothetical protein
LTVSQWLTSGKAWLPLAMWRFRTGLLPTTMQNVPSEFSARSAAVQRRLPAVFSVSRQYVAEIRLEEEE